MKFFKQPKSFEVTESKIEVEIKVEEEAREKAKKIGLKDGEQAELYIDIMKVEYKSPETDELCLFDVYNLAGDLIEKNKNFDEALDFLEYNGACPSFFSKDRKKFKDFAERAREILESERDTSLEPFDAEYELVQLKMNRGELLRKERAGKITHKEALYEFKKRFEKYRSEREWQKEGISYLRERVQEEIIESLQTFAGVSLGELRMIIENPEELKEFMKKKGADSLIDLTQIKKTKPSFVRILGLIREKASFYRLTKEQIKESEKETELILENRRKVGELRRQFTDDSELFEHITKNKPKGRIEVVEGPFSFYFRCYDDKDFAYFSSRRVMEGGKIEQKDINLTKSFDNMAISVVGGIFTAEKNSEVKPFDRSLYMLHLHEEQHIIDFLLKESWLTPDFREFLDYLIKLEYFWETGDKKKIREEVKKEIQRGLRKYREFEECKTSSEITSFLNQRVETEQILEILKEDGGFYDYFNKEKREEIFEYIRNSFESLNDFEIYAIINDVLVDGYYKNIDEAMEAIKTLQKNKVSKDKIISLLQPLPLHKWPAEARRVAKTRKKRRKTTI